MLNYYNRTTKINEHVYLRFVISSKVDVDFIKNCDTFWIIGKTESLLCRIYREVDNIKRKEKNIRLITRIVLIDNGNNAVQLEGRNTITDLPVQSARTVKEWR